MALKNNWIAGDTWTNLNANEISDAVTAVGMNVMHYAAAGDGLTDDSGAIQDAIDAAPSGGAVFFPAGTYLIDTIDTPITVTKPLRLYGTGPASILKLGAKANFFGVSDTNSVTIEGLTFDGDRGTVGSDYHEAVFFHTVTDSMIRNCRFLNSVGAAIIIANGSDGACQRITITDCYFSNVQSCGIYVGDPGTGLYNDHLRITNNYVATCQQNTAAGQAAIQFYGDEARVTNRNRWCHIAHNTVYNAGLVCLGLDSLDKSTVTGNTCVKDGSALGDGETIAFTGAENVFSNNYCSNATTAPAAGILLWASGVRSNAHNQIIGNRLTGTSGVGQAIAFVWGYQSAAITDLLIQGNDCWTTNIGVQSYIAGGVTSGSQSDILILGNNLTGNTSSATSLIQVGTGGITGTNPTLANNLT